MWCLSALQYNQNLLLIRPTHCVNLIYRKWSWQIVQLQQYGYVTHNDDHHFTTLFLQRKIFYLASTGLKNCGGVPICMQLLTIDHACLSSLRAWCQSTKEPHEDASHNQLKYLWCQRKFFCANNKRTYLRASRINAFAGWWVMCELSTPLHFVGSAVYFWAAAKFQEMCYITR